MKVLEEIVVTSKWQRLSSNVICVLIKKNSRINVYLCPFLWKTSDHFCCRDRCVIVEVVGERKNIIVIKTDLFQ
jgi:hypothetical protein